MVTLVIILTTALILMFVVILWLLYGISNLKGQLDVHTQCHSTLSDKLCLQQEFVFQKYGVHLPYSVRSLERAIGSLK